MNVEIKILTFNVNVGCLAVLMRACIVYILSGDHATKNWSGGELVDPSLATCTEYNSECTPETLLTVMLVQFITAAHVFVERGEGSYLNHTPNPNPNPSVCV